MDRQRRPDATLAGPAGRDRDQFLDLPARRLAPAGHRVEQSALAIVERVAEGRLEDGKPRRPARQVANGRAKQPGVAKGASDGDRRRILQRRP
jgi:hypothetical protein